MSYLFDLVREGDLCSLALAIAALYYIGRLFVQGRPQSHIAGIRVAAGTFVVVALMRLVESTYPMAEDIVSALFVGASAAGLVLGPSWIALGSLAFALDYVHRARQSLDQRLHQRRYARQEARRRVAEERRQRERNAEIRRQAPVRERQQEEARRQEQEARRHEQEARRCAREDKVRREEARLSCLLHLDQHRREIGKRFLRREMFEYFETYMSEEHPVEQVEARAQQVKNMLSQLAELQLGMSSARFQSVTEIETYYAEEREAIAASSYDQNTKDTLLVDVNREEDRALQELRRQ